MPVSGGPAASGAFPFASPPHAGDDVRYVSTSGSDSFDGSHWGAAKLTVQSAIDALSGPGVVLIGGGTFATSTPLRLASGVTLRGAGVTSTKLRAMTGDLVQVDATLRNVTFEDVWLSAVDGHLFDVAASVSLSFITWSRCLFEVFATGKSAINMPDGSFVDNLMDNCESSHTTSATVPTFYLASSTNAINSNSFRRLRCNYSGDYVFRVEATGGSYCYDNSFEDITFEDTRGGCIDLLSCQGTRITQCNTYDLASATTKDLYHIGTSTAGGAVASRLTTLMHVGRRGGTLGGGLSDVKIDASQSFTTMIACNTGGGTGFTVDWGSTTGTWIGRDVTMSNDPYVVKVINYTVRPAMAATGARPSATTQGAGAMAYDTTLGKPIWSNGSVWKDAAGTTV